MPKSRRKWKAASRAKLWSCWIPASLPHDSDRTQAPHGDLHRARAWACCLGLVIAGAREMKDTSLKNLKDVRAYTQMAILGSVPLLENDFVVRRRRRMAWLGWTTACLAAAVVMSGSVVYLLRDQSLTDVIRNVDGLGSGDETNESSS